MSGPVLRRRRVAPNTPPGQAGGRATRALGAAIGRLPAGVWAMPLVLIATGYAVPLLSKLFVDRVLTAGETGLALSVVAGLTLAAALRGAVTWWLRRRLLAVQIERAWTHSAQVMTAVLSGRQSGLGPGETAAILRGQDQAARLVYGEVVHSVIELPAVPLLFALMAVFDPLLAAIALMLTALNAAGFVAVSRRRGRMAARLAVERGRFVDRLARYLSVLPAIKAGGTEAAVLEDWDRAHARRARGFLALGRISERLGVLPGLLSGLSLAVILGVGAWLILQDRMTPGDLVACQSLFFAISDPVRRFIEASGRLEDVAAEVERRHALIGPAGATPAPLDLPPAEPVAPPADAALAVATRAAGPALALAGLRLGLDGREVAVPDRDLAAGSHLAVTGPTGAGKSALARVVAGRDRPAAGTVRVSGLDVQALPRGAMAATVGLVGRELAGLDGRLRDILTLWDDRVGDPALRRALHLAAADGFVDRLPGGLDTPVGPGDGAEDREGLVLPAGLRHPAAGIDFSGGQWQRLAIARALVPGPAVLVLDEALEALDLGLALTVLDRLAAAGVSAVLVAHRGETVARASAVLDLPGPRPGARR